MCDGGLWGVVSANQAASIYFLMNHSFYSFKNNIFALDVNIFNMNKELNRIKVVLVLKKKTGKWLAAQLQVSESTVSRWCSNAAQPNLSTLHEVAKLLGVEMRELLNDSDNI